MVRSKTVAYARRQNKHLQKAIYPSDYETDSESTDDDFIKGRINNIKLIQDAILTNNKIINGRL